jgi:hypothetical protein
MISIIHPSRSRPIKSFDTICRWLERAGFPVECIVAIDNNDPQKDQYFELYKGITDRYRVNFMIVALETRTAIQAINEAAKLSTGQIMVVVSDDTDCQWNWAGKIETVTKGKSDFVLAVNDGHQDHSKVITMPILDRVYYNRFGYIYHPSYSHLWCDKEFATVAYKLKRVIKTDLEFPHLQYSIIGEQPDSLNLRNNMTNEAGRRLYFQRLKQGFPK